MESHEAKVAPGRGARRGLLLHLQAHALCNPYLQAGLPVGSLTRVQSADSLLCELNADPQLIQRRARATALSRCAAAAGQDRAARAASARCAFPADAASTEADTHASRRPQTAYGQYTLVTALPLSPRGTSEHTATSSAYVGASDPIAHGQESEACLSAYERPAAAAANAVVSPSLQSACGSSSTSRPASGLPSAPSAAGLAETLHRARKQVASAGAPLSRGEILALVSHQLDAAGMRRDLPDAESSQESSGMTVGASAPNTGFGSPDEQAALLKCDARRRTKFSASPTEATTARMLSPKGPRSSLRATEERSEHDSLPGTGSEPSCVSIGTPGLDACRPRTGSRSRPDTKLRPPSASEMRTNKSVLVGAQLPRYSESRMRRTGQSARLSVKMQRIWDSLDESKQMSIRGPEKATRKVNLDLPFYERWTSLFLVPPADFQKSRRSARF